jgi:hypothetical protein
MIAFKDFAPRVLKEGGVFSDSTFQTLQEAVDAASRWCEHAHVVPLNVETVLLPNMYDSEEEGSKDVHLKTHETVDWHQIVRVWYLAK